MSFRQYGGLKFSSKNNYNNLINVTANADLPKTIGTPNTTIDVLSKLNIRGGINLDIPIDFTSLVLENLTVNNSLTVNGTSSFSGSVDFTGSGNLNFNKDNTYFNKGFQIRDTGATPIEYSQFYQNGPTLVIQPIAVNSRIQMSTCGSNGTTTSVNLLLEKGNKAILAGGSGAVVCDGDTINLYTTTSVPTMTRGPSYPSSTNINEIATVGYVTDAIAGSGGGGGPFVTLDTIQTITGTKSFATDIKITDNNIIFGASSTQLVQTGLSFFIKPQHSSSAISISTTKSDGHDVQNIRCTQGNKIRITGNDTNHIDISGNITTMNGNVNFQSGTFHFLNTFGNTGTTLDMDGSNDFIISNNIPNQRIIMNVFNGSGVNTNTATLGALADSGFLTSSSIGQSITATSTFTDTSGSSCGVLSTANINAFSGKSNKTGLSGRINLGISGTATYNPITSSNDAFVSGDNTAINLGALTLTTRSSSRLGVRINSNSGVGSANSVEVAGSLIELNTSTEGGLTSSTTQPAFNDSSNKIPTTAWVQSAITGGLSSPIPYYQAYYFINAPSLFDRPGFFQFNFTGSNWGVNDYFSFNFRCALNTTAPASTTLAPYFTVINGRVDVYPNRCPANASNPSAYGDNPTQPTTNNFSLASGAIFNGTSLQSSYVVNGSGVFAPFGRWYWVNGYSITSQGTSYPPSSPAPIAPYIAFGTPAQSAFGFGVWQTQLVQTNFAIFVELINRGPNGVGQGITLTSNFSTSGGNTLNEVKVGF